MLFIVILNPLLTVGLVVIVRIIIIINILHFHPESPSLESYSSSAS
jgi:hypothetical protein